MKPVPLTESNLRLAAGVGAGNAVRCYAVVLPDKIMNCHATADRMKHVDAHPGIGRHRGLLELPGGCEQSLDNGHTIGARLSTAEAGDGEAKGDGPSHGNRARKGFTQIVNSRILPISFTSLARIVRPCQVEIRLTEPLAATRTDRHGFPCILHSAQYVLGMIT